MTDAITPTNDPAERGLATCGNTCIDRSAGSVDLALARERLGQVLGMRDAWPSKNGPVAS